MNEAVTYTNREGAMIRTIETKRHEDGTYEEFEKVVGVGTTVEKRSVYLYDGIENDLATYLDESGEWRSVNYGGGDMSRSWGGWATVDATPEIAAAWKAHVEEQARKRAAAEARRNAEITSKSISRGSEVVVVRGRKVPVGTRGRAIWSGRTRFGYRVGIALADESVVWTAAENVEVTIEEYLAKMARYGYDVEAEAVAAGRN